MFKIASLYFCSNRLASPSLCRPVTEKTQTLSDLTRKKDSHGSKILRHQNVQTVTIVLCGISVVFRNTSALLL